MNRYSSKKTSILLLLLVLMMSFINITTLANEKATYNYIIITTKDIVTHSLKLDDFITHKQRLGYSVYVATEDEYEQINGPPPNGRAEKIRQWLIENYIDMNIKYVLFIGNPDPDHPIYPRDTVGDIPMKLLIEIWDPELPFGKIVSFISTFVQKAEYTTDYYYADLTGNWDFDGDSVYGEGMGDNIDSGGAGVNLTPEVFVGRIPVYDTNYNDLDHILQKTIEYESTSENLEYRTKVLLLMCFPKIGLDYARLGEQIINDILIPHTFSYWRMYQQGSSNRFLDSIYTSEEELLDGKVRERWSKEPFGIVCWMGHGNETISMIGTSNFIDGVLFGIDDCQYLDDTHPAFTFQASCSNGLPEESNNLGYCLLKHGAIATISGSGVTTLSYVEDYTNSWGSGGIAYDYVKYLVNGYSAGEALYLGKMSPAPTSFLPHTIPIKTFRNIYNYNLYGDPSLHLLR